MTSCLSATAELNQRIIQNWEGPPEVSKHCSKQSQCCIVLTRKTFSLHPIRTFYFNFSLLWRWCKCFTLHFTFTIITRPLIHCCWHWAPWLQFRLLYIHLAYFLHISHKFITVPLRWQLRVVKVLTQAACSLSHCLKSSFCPWYTGIQRF